MEKKQVNKPNISNNKSNKKKRKMKTWKKILIVIFILLLIAGGIFTYRVYKNGWGLSGMLATVVGHDENTKKDLKEFKCLVLGISTDQKDVNLTDTIIVASYNPNTQKATLLSIPRDTYTGKTPARATAYEKINALYSRKNRPDETLAAVNELTGLDIQYYVVVKTEALIKLVDAIGGVTFNVPINMNYDDVTQGLKIDLKAGEQVLDGNKAEQLVRFRHNNNGTSYPSEYGDNDTGRMKTQREFIIQVLKQTLKPGNIFKLGEILDIANEYITTNLDINYVKDYIPYAVEFNTENLVTGVIPGENTNKNTSGTWVFLPNKTETKALVQELFIDRDITKETTENATQENSTDTTTKKSDIKIEILNGTNSSTTLQNVVSKLEKEGYKITKKGTTNKTSKTSISGTEKINSTVLTDIKDSLGVGTISNNKQSTKIDVTIIIGNDYKN